MEQSDLSPQRGELVYEKALSDVNTALKGQASPSLQSPSKPFETFVLEELSKCFCTFGPMYDESQVGYITLENFMLLVDYDASQIISQIAEPAQRQLWETKLQQYEAKGYNLTGVRQLTFFRRQENGNRFATGGKLKSVLVHYLETAEQNRARVEQQCMEKEKHSRKAGGDVSPKLSPQAGRDMADEGGGEVWIREQEARPSL